MPGMGPGPVVGDPTFNVVGGTPEDGGEYVCVSRTHCKRFVSILVF